MSTLFLNNIYYLIRHGRSIANEKHIIISDPANGLENFGLTNDGIKQIEALFLNNYLKNIDFIYSSDFLRAKQSALIIARKFNCNVVYDKRLRERNFGEYEKSTSKNYYKIWDLDCKNVNSCNSVESISSVYKRMIDFLIEVDKTHINKHIVIVSHGDPLQILYTTSLNYKLHEFRKIKSFENAELRILKGKIFIPDEVIS